MLLSATFAKALCDGILAALVGRFLIHLFQTRRHMFSASSKNELLEHWITFLLPFTKRIRIHRYRAWLKKNMRHAGENPDPDLFMGWQILCASVGCALGYLLFSFGLGKSSAILSCTLFAGLWPALKLSGRANARLKQINRDVPFFIDYLALAMGSGLDFQRSLQTVIQDCPRSPVSEEFGVVLSKMRLGRSTHSALNSLCNDIDSPSLKLFCHNLQQSLELGTNSGESLRIISDTLSTKRFQKAEELAGKISVRMIIPMMVFVLPAVMIILVGPMMIEFFAVM